MPTKLTMADGKRVYIAMSTVYTLEALNLGDNENYPEAQSFLRYFDGVELHHLLLNDEFDDVRIALPNKTFVEVEMRDGLPLIFLPLNLQDLLPSPLEGFECRVGLMLPPGALFRYDVRTDTDTIINMVEEAKQHIPNIGAPDGEALFQDQG